MSKFSKRFDEYHPPPLNPPTKERVKEKDPHQRLLPENIKQVFTFITKIVTHTNKMILKLLQVIFFNY